MQHANIPTETWLGYTSKLQDGERKARKVIDKRFARDILRLGRICFRKIENEGDYVVGTERVGIDNSFNVMRT